jgi:CNT family concentrative nucleoside transporter
VSDAGARATSAAGFAVLLALSWALSSDRRHVPWRAVAWGVGIQLGLGALLLLTPFGAWFFDAMNGLVDGLAHTTDAGVRFVFGALVDVGFSFAVQVLPIIVVMGSLFAVLYHFGVLQRVVDVLGTLLARTMGTSGAESLAAVANIFLGMTESALVVRPYLERMTSSELFSLMTVGMSTVAGSVLVAYAAMLGPGYAGHLATASLLSAPAGLLVAKLMVPEREQPLTGAGGGRVEIAREAINVFDAAARGAVDGLRLAAYVGAMLVAFVALIAGINAGLAAVGAPLGIEGLSLQRVFGVLFAPFAFLMGIPWSESLAVGGLLGIKTVLNEFIAYQQLAALSQQGALTPRSVAITSYALCGFANFGSLAILLGGLGGLVPSRREEVARFGLRSVASGTLASFMTACVAGMLL